MLASLQRFAFTKLAFAGAWEALTLLPPATRSTVLVFAALFLLIVFASALPHDPPAEDTP